MKYEVACEVVCKKSWYEESCIYIYIYVPTSYFNCVMNVTAWKLKVENIVRDIFILYKIQKKTIKIT